MRGAYVFVAIVYVILAASFIASTATLVQEFRDHDWLSMALTHSHLFVFFPTFGIVVLAAFYRPSVVFTHMYWSQPDVVRLGRVRFAAGFFAAVVASGYVAQLLSGGPLRGIWEVKPLALAAEREGSVSCRAANGTVGTCRRAPLLETLQSIREHGRTRVGLGDLARNCSPDPLIEKPQSHAAARYCFPAGRLLDTPQCCAVQRDLALRLAALHQDPAMRSRTAELDRFFLPLKVFFIVIMVVIAILLAVWRKRLDELYPDHVPAMERGIIIGGVGMLLWPLMDYAYLQTSMTMFGRPHDGIHMRWSLVIVPWAILLPFFFLRQLDRNRELIAQGASVLASFIAVLRYPEINDWAVRTVGAGAEPWIFALIVAVAFVAFIALFASGGRPPEIDGEARPTSLPPPLPRDAQT